MWENRICQFYKVCTINKVSTVTLKSNLLDRLKTLCARARSMFLQFLRPIGQNYKSDLSDLVQSDSIDFSCLSPHSDLFWKFLSNVAARYLFNLMGFIGKILLEKNFSPMLLQRLQNCVKRTWKVKETWKYACICTSKLWPRIFIWVNWKFRKFLCCNILLSSTYVPSYKCFKQ